MHKVMLNLMNHEILQKTFFSHPQNTAFLLNTFNQTSIKEMFPITIFEIADTSTVLLMHDKNDLFICIFCEAIVVKVDEMLLTVFEKAYNDIFHTCQKNNINQLRVVIFSKNYIFNETSKYNHTYKSNDVTEDINEKSKGIMNTSYEYGSKNENEGVNQNKSDETQHKELQSVQSNDMQSKEVKLFSNISINVIEIKKAYNYAEDQKTKNLSAIFIQENPINTDASININININTNTSSSTTSDTNTNSGANINEGIAEIMYHMNPKNWNEQELIKYYDKEASVRKVLGTQKNAFTEGFKIGQHDGQVSTAYFIKELLSEKNPNIDNFLVNLCYVRV